MSDSLSLICAVRDVEATLRRHVVELLDVLPELTTDFEIVIVDDGSADHTKEEADSLARQFPQVRVVSHQMQRSFASAIDAGCHYAVGSFLCVHSSLSATDPAVLRRLWQTRHQMRGIRVRTKERTHTLDPDLIERLMKWGIALRARATVASEFDGHELIRRERAPLAAECMSEASAAVPISVG